MKPPAFVYAVILIILFIDVPSYAQLEVSAEIRPRGEFRRGYKTLVQKDKKNDPAFVVSQRTRLKLVFERNRIKANITFQDARVWGDESLYSSTGVFGDKGSLDLYEAWMQIGIARNIFIKTGRQEWKYDDQRLLSNRNWNQRGVTYDGLLIGYRPENWQIDGGASWNNDAESLLNEPYNSDKIRTLDFLYLKRKISPELSASTIALLSGYQKNDTSGVIYLKGTYGANVWFENDFLFTHAAGYYQNGRNKSGQNVNAYAFIASARLEMNGWRFGPGLEWFSGNDRLKSVSGLDEQDHFFDILYGRRHAFYGYMDYFSNMRKATGGSGLIDALFRLDKTFAVKHNIELTCHYFALENNYQVEAMAGQYKKLDAYLASEADLVYRFSVNESWSLDLGYSVLLPNSTLEILNNLDEKDSVTGQWAWFMITYKPILFNSDSFLLK